MKNTAYIVLALAATLIVLLACTTPYPTMPDDPDEPRNNIVGHAINYEQMGFARPDNADLQPTTIDFTDTSQKYLAVTASEDAIYKVGYLSVRGNDWQPFNLTGNQAYGPWLLDEAEGNLTLREIDFGLQAGDRAADNYILVFSCTYLPDEQSWDCHGNQWQLNQFNTSRPETCTEGCLHEGECYNVGEYLAAIDSTCETYGWREMPAEPTDPNPIDDTTDPCEGVDCDDGNPCTTDTCSEGTCTNTPVADETSCPGDGDPCTTDECISGTCTHTPIEGCGEESGCLGEDPCNLALLDGVDWPFEIETPLRSVDDYADVVYIDPSHPSPGDGSSPDTPLASWDVVTFEPDTAYVQKRGTTFHQTGSGILVDADRVLLGAYGDGARPAISDESSSRATLYIDEATQYVTVRDLELRKTSNMGDYERALKVEGDYATVYNNTITGTDTEMYYFVCLDGEGYASRIVHNELAYCGEGLFGGGTSLEFGHNHLHHSGFTYGGDLIQVYGSEECVGMWFHDNVLNGSIVWRKFAIINTDCPNAGATFLIENNQMYMSGGRPFLHLKGHLVIRNNVMEHEPYIADPEDWGGGIYLVGGSSEYTSSEIYNNVVSGWNISLTTSGNRKVFNNLFLDYEGLAAGDAEGTSEYTNNIFAGTGKTWWHYGAEAATNNLIVYPEFVIDEREGDNPVYGDPMLDEEYRPMAGSPAIDTGDDTAFDRLTLLPKDNSGFTDLAGNPVPDSGVDIGPYQQP